MCGRIRQARGLREYEEQLRWNPRTALDVADGLKYNVPPGTRPIAMHRLGDGAEQVDRLHWGYRPHWYKDPALANANLKTILRGSGMWKPILSNRIIVPADGWYEWTGKKPNKQPWFISPRDERPIFMAGFTAWQPGREILEQTGFAIVTDATAGGMVDIHDRRPVCLTVDDALAWMDPDVPAEEALQILSTPRPESAFRWWQVPRKVGSSRYQMPDASEPM